MTERNVQVDIVTARYREQYVYSRMLNSNLLRKLKQHGANVYEEPYKLFHMKAFAIDSETIAVGSWNCDHWTYYVNNEANLLIQTEER